MPQAKGPRENGGSGKDKGTASPELAKDRKKKQKRIKETCAQPNKGKKKNRVGLVNEYGGVSTKSGTVICKKKKKKKQKETMNKKMKRENEGKK